MANGTKGHGGPASTPSKTRGEQILDRALAELEKRRLIARGGRLDGGSVVVTQAGYAELVRRRLVRS